MDFSKYLFRCSALGNIISKSGKLTKENTTYLRDLFIGEINGIQKDITSKYFEKGMFCEQDAMQILQDSLYPKSFVKSYKKQVKNEFLQGTPDVIMPDYLYDIKNAFDRFTFGKADCTWEYEWQIKAYLWLTERTQGRLFYVLCNMPEHLIQDEERQLFYKGKFLTTESKDYQDACEELRKKLNFTSMKLHERFKIWDIVLTDEDIETMKNAVENARIHLKNLSECENARLSKNLELINNAAIG